ncbi:MAG: hypothetical protein EOO46_13920 [Flavobacterium sp.]|nr:MAG: hypothetical protein EOO46_13920 [Flavobacterium sp.]
MKAITLKPYYFVLSFLFTITVSYSQTVFDHNGNFVIQQDEEYYPGKIILKSNDTLVGKISLNYRIKENFSALFNDGAKEVKIPNESIGKIILSNRNNEWTEFESLDNSKQLYRILYSGKVKIYDSSSKPQGGNLVSGVFIKENDKVYSLFNFWSSGPKQDLIDYINKRDGENFKRRDFKNSDEIFAYLDK